MFRFSSPRVYRTTTFLFYGDSKTTLRFHGTPFLVRNFGANKATDESSFTVSYLIKSCGLSKEKAISVSRKIQLKSSSQPDTVLAFFNQEFPNTNILKIIEKHPTVLLSNVSKNLKPKIEFLKSIGFSSPDLAKFLLKAPKTFSHSLENKIMPLVAFLKSILLKESSVIRVIQRSIWRFDQDPQKKLAPNIALLRSHGVPNQNILRLLVSSPNTLAMPTTERLNVLIEDAKKMQCDPFKFVFVKALQGLGSMRRSSWKAKTDVYKSWGWSDDDVYMAFRKQPQCMMLSQKKIMAGMEFLVSKLGYDSLLLVKWPYVLVYSLEKRLIPRFSVIHVLISNNIVKKGCYIGWVCLLTDEAFLEKFVTKFKEQLPQLLDVYKGKTNAL